MGDRSALLAVALPLVALKLWAALLLLVFSPVGDTAVFVAVTHWPIGVVVALLIAGPFIAWYRLVRVRARREHLRRQEWMLDTVDGKSSRHLDQWPRWESVPRREGGSGR